MKLDIARIFSILAIAWLLFGMTSSRQSTYVVTFDEGGIPSSTLLEAAAKQLQIANFHFSASDESEYPYKHQRASAWAGLYSPGSSVLHVGFVQLYGGCGGRKGFEESRVALDQMLDGMEGQFGTYTVNEWHGGDEGEPLMSPVQ